MQTYKFYNTFKKSCKQLDNDINCVKTHESTQCIDNKCKSIKTPDAKNKYYNHDKKYPFTCPECNYSSSTFNKFAQHIKQHCISSIKTCNKLSSKLLSPIIQKNIKFDGCYGNCGQSGGCGPLCLAPLLLII